MAALVSDDEIGVSSVLSLPFYDSLGLGTVYVPPSAAGDMVVSCDRTRLGLDGTAVDALPSNGMGRRRAWTRHGRRPPLDWGARP